MASGRFDGGGNGCWRWEIGVDGVLGKVSKGVMGKVNRKR